MPCRSPTDEAGPRLGGTQSRSASATGGSYPEPRGAFLALRIPIIPVPSSALSSIIQATFPIKGKRITRNISFRGKFSKAQLGNQQGTPGANEDPGELSVVVADGTPCNRCWRWEERKDDGGGTVLSD